MDMIYIYIWIYNIGTRLTEKYQKSFNIKYTSNILSISKKTGNHRKGFLS